MKKALLVLGLLMLTSTGCPKPDEPPAAACPMVEDYTSRADGKIAVQADPGLIYQSLTANGQPGAIYDIEAVRVIASTSYLKSLQLEIRREESHASTSGPEQWFLQNTSPIAVSLVTSGMGGTFDDTTVDFVFSSPVKMEAGVQHLFVLRGSGGTFSVRTMPTAYLLAPMGQRTAAGTWTSPDQRVAFAIKFSGCE